MQGGDQVGEAYDTTYDLGLLRVSKMPDGYGRFWRRDQQQIVPIEFAPTDRITVVAQFYKIDWAFMFARPHTSNDFVLLRIDLHERSRFPGEWRFATDAAQAHESEWESSVLFGFCGHEVWSRERRLSSAPAAVLARALGASGLGLEVWTSAVLSVPISFADRGSGQNRALRRCFPG
jgi:hypothetical protein